MKVAAYIRVSTEAQMENYSIPLQKERIGGYCVSKGWDDITYFIDGGFSGSNIVRPDMQKMIANIKDYDVVIVYRLDRLSRSQKDTLHLIEDVFLPNNTDFVSISETLDTSSSFGRAMIGILAVFAQLERETITERLWSGRYKMVKEEGLWAGGTDAAPAGYIRHERGRLEVNQTEAEIVKRVFREYLVDYSISKIQKKFRAEGLPVWPFSRYVRVLRNRLYIGKVSFAGQEYDGTHEPLVSTEDFDKVQELMQRHKGKNHGKAKHVLLSGRVQCGYCGEPMVSYITGKQVLATGEKVRYFYYICKRRRIPAEYPSKCLAPTVPRQELEASVFAAIDNLTYNDFLKTKKIKHVDYGKSIDAVDKKIKKLLDLYIAETIDKILLDEAVAELTSEKNKLFKEKDKQDQNNINREILELLKDKTFKMSELDYDDQLPVVKLLVNKVVVGDENIEIIWNQ